MHPMRSITQERGSCTLAAGSKLIARPSLLFFAGVLKLDGAVFMLGIMHPFTIGMHQVPELIVDIDS